jgi:hypothetical protein
MSLKPTPKPTIYSAASIRLIMVDLEADTNIQPDMFRHSPLPKERGSFRLIQVKPDLSMDGLLDCYLQDALVQESNYICLSYTWGQPGDDYPIKLNGRLCHVRRNLYDFLQAARQRLTFCTLWIDALCINQSNIEERNHQVQQMGNIFAGAVMVVAWLGNSPPTQDFIKAVELEYDCQTWPNWESFYLSKRNAKVNEVFSSDLRRSPYSHPLQALQDTGNERFLPLYKGLSRYSSFNEKHVLALFENAYWKRAWVTQEILLAQALVVMAGEHAIEFPLLARVYPYTIDTEASNPLEEYASLMWECKSHHIENGPSGAVALSGQWESTLGLLGLLRHFSGKCCALRRDRIYSLLGLGKGGDKIRVDYDGPDIELIMQVLNACKDEMCFCAAATVARIVKGPDFPHLEKEAYDTTVTYDFRLRAYSSDRDFCPVCGNQVTRNGGKQRPGVYFCLQCSSDSCSQWQGHLFWDNSRRGDETDPFGFYDILRLARGDVREPRALCRKGRGIEIIPVESDDYYTLRFSLDTLVNVMNITYEDEKQFVSSHTCRG